MNALAPDWFREQIAEIPRGSLTHAETIDQAMTLLLLNTLTSIEVLERLEYLVVLMEEKR